MATTTFSGPIKAGTISNTTGTTVGTDMKNTGQVVMAQTHAIDLSGGAATTFVNTFAIGTTVGLKRPSTEAGGSLAWEDVGTTDVRLNVTNSAATSSGECRITVLYQQNNNLA